MTELRRVLIADDEAPARARVRDLLAEQSGYFVVAESDSGPSALQAMRTLAPELVFLDVQMPGHTGLEVLSQIEPHARPVTVFTTAFERYALDAFEASAIDYLLKPYTDERFFEALGRAELCLDGRTFKEWRGRLLNLLHGTAGERVSGEANGGTPLAGERPIERFAVRQRDRIVLIDVRDVSWIEASRDYLELHVGTTRHLTRMTMQEAEERLDRGAFARIHRSTIVRLDDIAAIEPFSGSEDVAVLRDGTRLRVSRRYRQELRARLGMG
jgi:two-component system, LytTR family, response regulator